MPRVRAALLKLQRDFAAQPQGAVLDGRDIGTVICPDALVKLYITAHEDIRTTRRLNELNAAINAFGDAAGPHFSFEDVLAQVRARDERDQNRAVAPAKQAVDAHLLDTTHLGIDAAFRAAVDIIEAVRAGRRRR